MKYKPENGLPVSTLYQTHEHGGRFAMALGGPTVYLDPATALTLLSELARYLQAQAQGVDFNTKTHEV